MEQIETEIRTQNPLRLTKHFETMWRLPTLFLLTKSLFVLANTTLSATVSRPLLRGAGLSPSLRLIKCVHNHQSMRSVQYGYASLQYCHRTEYLCGAILTFLLLPEQAQAIPSFARIYDMLYRLPYSATDPESVRSAVP